MSLEKFRRSRMVILTPKATAYQAARAMSDNHVGSVLVSDHGKIVGMVTDRDLALAVLGDRLDPDRTPLRNIMSEDIITCEIGAGVQDAARLMREHGVRRLPLLEGGKPVGLVTFDDLVVDGNLGADELRSIVSSQLEVEAPQKPAGVLHPIMQSTAATKTRALMRARTRAESTYHQFLQAIADAADLSRNSAEQALLVAGCMLCRRLIPGEAEDLIAQLPSMAQPHLYKCAKGPDRSVTTEAIIGELARELGFAPDRAEQVMHAVLRVIAENVSADQMAEVRGQLPDEMKGLIPVMA